MPPAARITDMHTCPMVIPGTPPIPHVGGPICGPCVPPVLIEYLPAAVVGDKCVCVGPPDTIAAGSPTVLINNKPAARMGDPTAHGGVIVKGAATVLIGGAVAVVPAAPVPAAAQVCVAPKPAPKPSLLARLATAVAKVVVAVAKAVVAVVKAMGSAIVKTATAVANAIGSGLRKLGSWFR